MTALAWACAVILAIAGIFGLRLADSSKVAYDEETLKWEAETLSDVVDIGGVRCEPKRNLRTYLFLGIDDTAVQSDSYVSGGQSDMLMLLVVDQTNQIYYKLPINRNTMCEVRSFDSDWEDVGTSVCQIALAYAHGDGGSRSGENAADAVSNLLSGVRIDNYLALKIDAIPTINRMAGGVTVTIEDDFSQEDPSLVMGETITLNDQQAVHYVRGRMSVGDGTNESRMRRQSNYFEQMLERVLYNTRVDVSYATDFYDALTPYITTNMNGKAFSRLIRALTDCESGGMLQIEGDIGKDDFGFATFEPDATSLRDTIIRLFYTPVDDENT